MKTSETSAVVVAEAVPAAAGSRSSFGGFRRSRRRVGPLTAKRQRAGLVFALPVVALVGSLLLYPTGQSIYYSFTTWDGISAHWVGTAAYAHLFHSPDFSQVLKNNAYFAHSNRSMLETVSINAERLRRYEFVEREHATAWEAE